MKVLGKNILFENALEYILGFIVKKIEVIIREEALDQLKKALAEAGFSPLTAYPVRGRGRQGGIRYRWPEGIEYYDLLPRIKVELVVDDEEVEKVVDIIVNTFRRGVPGDGKIFILPVEEVIRIRTGERGSKAIK